MVGWSRAWDLAASKGSGDFTVGVLMGLDKLGRFWVTDIAEQVMASEPQSWAKTSDAVSRHR